KVYVDSNCFIYAVERIEPYAAALQPLWQAGREGRLGIVTSELTLLEVLVKPMREEDALLEDLYRRLLMSSTEVALAHCDAELFLHAASIRARQGLSMP